MTGQARGGPLQGVRVVELTKVWAGPYAGKLLAFLGAEVIRVESEGSLDVTRTYGVADINNAPGFQAVNPQKLSVQIDMKTARGHRSHPGPPGAVRRRDRESSPRCRSTPRPRL